MWLEAFQLHFELCDLSLDFTSKKPIIFWVYDHKDMFQREIVSSFSPIKMMFVVMFEERINYEIDIKLWL